MTEHKNPVQPNADEVWHEVSQLLRNILGSDLFDLWFSQVACTLIDAEEIVLSVPNEFCATRLKEIYISRIRGAVESITNRRLNVKFTIRATQSREEEGYSMFRKQSDSSMPAESGQITDATTPLFNPKNTFDTFVVGSNNSFAHAAALAVAKEPGKSYNPLFLYGGVGLGKTHLLHAIGQHVRINFPHQRTIYVPCEKFTNDFIDAIQNNSIAKFRKRYRNVDVLLIDDVHFLAGKERIQEEFFHTFNALHESHRLLVMTCDRPAGEIQGLEQRLVSRFEWGLVTDMQPPDIETRIAILSKKARDLGVELPNDVKQFLAARIRANVRRLEGGLVRLASYVSLTGSKLTLETAENLLRDVLSEEGKYAISIDVIQRKVAEHFDIRIADMTSKRKPENIAFPRQVAMYLARFLTESSLRAIGEAFGGRDQSTVLHACRLVRDRMEVDTHVREAVAHLERKLQR